jgi:ribonucleotide reductase alpha subunit
MISKIKKRNGDVVNFDANKLTRWAEWAGVVGADWFAIAGDAYKRCPDECTTQDLQNSMIQACSEKEDTAHLKMAGRLLIGDIYKQAFGGHEKIPTVVAMYNSMVSKGLWSNMGYSTEDLAVAETIINHTKDLNSIHSVVHQITSKYSIRDVEKNIVLESPQFVWLRMALGVCINEPRNSRMQEVESYYKDFSEGRINAPTPNIVNLGTPKMNYASCAVFKSNDNAKSLASGDHIAYTMTCASAGIGGFIQTRSKGDGVRNNTIKHAGKLPYYRATEASVHANLQGGRGGAATIHFNCLDPEVFTLLRLRHPTTVAKNKIGGIDYSFGYTPLLAKKAANNEQWMLVSYKTSPKLHEALYSASGFEEAYNEYEASEGKREYVSARKLVLEFLRVQEETGRMYEHNIQEMNRHTPFKDVIYSSNLCFSGDTLVATADGRNAVSIKELADGSQGHVKFPVYSARLKRSNSKGGAWKTEIKNAIAFKTGVRSVIELGLSDGSSFKCTPEHQIALPSGIYKQAKDLLGVSVAPFFSSIGDSRKYRHINSTTNGHSKQHIMMWEFSNGKVPAGYNIDHIINVACDKLTNLQLLTIEDHRCKTASEVCGTNNAMHKLRDKVINNNNCCESSHLENNGRYLGLTNEDMIAIAVDMHSQGKRITLKSMSDVDSRMPKSFSKNRFGGLFSNLVKIAKGLMEYIPPVAPEKMSYVKDFFKVSELTVVSIKECGDEDVYDLTVEDNHNFYIITKGMDEDYLQCSGVLVHNCQEIGLPTKGYRSVEDLYVEGDVGGEIGLCNLAAIVVGRVKDSEYEEVAYRALKMVDNVISLMEYPFPNLKYTSNARRSAGVGITNLANDLAHRGFDYTSFMSKAYLHRVAERHSYFLHKASVRLAKERGKCEWFHKTKYSDGWLLIDTYCKEVDNITPQKLIYDWEALRKEIKEFGMRNSVLEAFMPK